MIPPNRAGWLCTIIGTLVVGFALGWSSATLREPPVVGENPQASPGKGGLQSIAFAASSARASTISEDSSSQQASTVFSAEAVSTPVGALGESLRGALKLADFTDRSIRFREIFRTLSVEQLPDAFEQVKKLRQTDRYQVLAALGKRWAELDVKGALAFGLENGRLGLYGGYNSFLYSVVNNWAGSAPSEAVNWVNSLPPGEDRNNMLQAAISAIGRTDPRGALQLLQTHGVSSQVGQAMDGLFAEWAEREPLAAAAAAVEMQGNTSYLAMRGVARTWAQENPRAAMAWGERIPNNATRRQVMNMVVDYWVDSDPLAVLAWSREVQDPETKRNAVSRSIASLAGKDLPAALAQIEALEEGEDRNRAVMSAANTLGRQDARSALQLLNQLAPGPERTRAIAQMCSTWAGSEPRAAVEWMFENNAFSGTGYEFSNVLGRWVGAAPDEAITWVQRLPAGEKREAAMAGLVSSLAFQQTERAQALFNQLSPESKAAVAEQFTYALANADLEKARTWAETLPQGKAQAVALGTIAYRMADRNVTETVQWLETLPPGPGRDRAVLGFSNQASRRDPDAALAWALTISDEVDRTQQVESLYRNWKSTDSAAARKWLETNNQISSAQRRRLQER